MAASQGERLHWIQNHGECSGKPLSSSRTHSNSHSIKKKKSVGSHDILNKDIEKN